MDLLGFTTVQYVAHLFGRKFVCSVTNGTGCKKMSRLYGDYDNKHNKCVRYYHAMARMFPMDG